MTVTGPKQPVWFERWKRLPGGGISMSGPQRGWRTPHRAEHVSKPTQSQNCKCSELKAVGHLSTQTSGQFYGFFPTVKKKKKCLETCESFTFGSNLAIFWGSFLTNSRGRHKTQEQSELLGLYFLPPHSGGVACPRRSAPQHKRTAREDNRWMEGAGRKHQNRDPTQGSQSELSKMFSLFLFLISVSK